MPAGLAKSPTSRIFQDTLQTAIDAEFGTQARLAAAIGVTAPAINHHLKEEKTTSPSALQDILSAFSSIRLRKGIHEAWIQQFASCPVDMDFDDGLGQAISQIKDLLYGDFPQDALQLSLIGRGIVAHEESWNALTELAVLALIRLMRTSDALDRASEMAVRAKERRAPKHMATALWLRQSALRNAYRIDTTLLSEAHQGALDVLRDWTPYSQEEIREKEFRSAALYRDLAQNILAIMGPAAHFTLSDEKKLLRKTHLQNALRAVERSLADDPEYHTLCLGLEVKSRVQLAIEEPHFRFHSAGTFEELMAAIRKGDTQFEPKTQILDAMLRMSESAFDHARLILQSVSEHCSSTSNVNHLYVAEQLLQGSWSGGR